MQSSGPCIPPDRESWPLEKKEVFLLSLVWEDIGEDIQRQDF